MDGAKNNSIGNILKNVAILEKIMGYILKIIFLQ